MFQVPKGKKSVKQNLFEFEYDGEKYALPKLKFAGPAAAEHFENGRVASGALAACPDDRTRAALRAMDHDEFDALTDAWADDSKVSPGESRGSKSSSVSTEEPSNTTSSGSGSD